MKLKLRFGMLALIAVSLMACSSDRSGTNQANSSSPQQSSSPARQQTVLNHSGESSGAPLVSSHGSQPGQSAAATQPQSGSTDTSQLDKKIEAAEKKASQQGASQSDKEAAAALYLERANVYFSAGTPSLYRYALRDFRYVLLYQPGNEEAQQKLDTIESIYRGMGRPVPQDGPPKN